MYCTLGWALNEKKFFEPLTKLFIETYFTPKWIRLILATFSIRAHPNVQYMHWIHSPFGYVPYVLVIYNICCMHCYSNFQLWLIFFSCFSLRSPRPLRFLCTIWIYKIFFTAGGTLLYVVRCTTCTMFPSTLSSIMTLSKGLNNGIYILQLFSKLEILHKKVSYFQHQIKIFHLLLLLQ